MTASLNFAFNLGAAGKAAQRDPQRPMRILVMGDFSGRASGAQDGAAGLAARTPRRIDIDNLDLAPGRLGCALQLALDGAGAAPVRIELQRFDDFEAEQLLRQPGLFGALADLRAQLDNPASFEQAAARLGIGAPPPAAHGEAADNPFAQLLGGAIQRPAAPADGAPGGLAAFVKSVVGKVAIADPRHAQALAALDRLRGERLRAVLHDPAFRALEASWRSLELLVGDLELDEQLQLYLLDVSKDELQTDLAAAGADLGASDVFRLLVEQARRAPDGEPWSVLVGDYRFDTGAQDIALLAALGAIGAQAGAPWLAAAADPQAGDDDGAARWAALRHSAQAGWIGLATQGLLLRLPYGKKTDRIAAFDFEELGDAPVHADYLWGNPAYACALLLGRAFEQEGWDMQPGDQLDIDDLPAHTWQQDGEAQLQACGGAYLSEREAGAILQQGRMPLLSFKNRSAVRLLRFQSIADPARALCGPWQAG
ncbi:MAG: type VI secretion system contractile sheath large subunit [Pseudomonadota bacterium]|nr:type VI secretion system contractile sheath large subunit [Pseudomonadota bacterium]